MGLCVLPPEVYNELLHLAAVKEQVFVSTPSSHMLYLLPVGCLIVFADEANHCCVVLKVDDGARSTYRFAVRGERE